MPRRIEVAVSGPALQRAEQLCRALVVTAATGGGNGWEAALEPYLTEMANDRIVGALTTIRLAQLVALAAGELAEGEFSSAGCSPSEGDITERALLVVDELMALAANP